MQIQSDIFVLYETVAMQAVSYCVAVAKIESNQLALLRPLDGSDWFFRYNIAKNTNTPTVILVALSKDEDWEIREVLALNTKTPITTLVELSEDDDIDVRRAVARNENATVAILKLLGDDIDYHVRVAVAENPNTPVYTLVNLSKDKSEDLYIRRVAKKSLKKKVKEQYFVPETNKDNNYSDVWIKDK